MEQEKRKRPGEHAPKERPQTPASKPRDPRPRTGSAAAREAARRERLSAREEPKKTVRSAAEEQPAPAERPARKPARQAPRKQAVPEEAAQSAPKRKKKKPHRVYNTNFGFKFGIMLAVVAAVVLSMIIFFKVKHIEVVLPGDGEEGQSYYTKEELIEASGINLDENLLSLSKATVASRIHAALPYVNEIQIKKQLPSTVVISFTEFEVTYAIQDERGGWWLMSREGRILEAANEQTIHGHLQVNGMPIKVPEIGDYFRPAAAEGVDLSEISNKQTVVLQTIPALEKTPFVKNIDKLDVSASYDLKLWYGTRYEIRLGTTEKLEYKLNVLQEILNNTDIQRKSGIIDISFTEDDRARFLPFS